jgi:hypothetical protein
MNHHKRFWPIKILFFLLAAAFLLLLAGVIVMQLWNWILPDLLGVNALSIWHAIGLLVLCRLLFGSWSRFGPPGFSRNRGFWRDKWRDMTDEEKEVFKTKWKERCGR